MHRNRFQRSSISLAACFIAELSTNILFSLQDEIAVTLFEVERPGP